MPKFRFVKVDRGTLYLALMLDDCLLGFVCRAHDHLKPGHPRIKKHYTWMMFNPNLSGCYDVTPVELVVAKAQLKTTAKKLLKEKAIRDGLIK